MVKQRNYLIDILKTIAIIAVVLYHMGEMTYGYLGVDLFLVISGYFLSKSVLSRDLKCKEIVPDFISRLLRLYPLLIIAVVISMGLGFFFMLPDDLENLSSSVIATLASSNNILAAITTKNYWDVLNDLKPFMHTWYLGVLVQFYVSFYFLYAISRIPKTDEKKKLTFKILLILGTVISFALYLLPQFDFNMKFYMLPFRFFEVGIGCICAYIPFKNFKFSKVLSYAALVVLVLLMVIPFEFCAASVRLISVCVLSVLLVLMWKSNKDSSKLLYCLSVPGKMSYSIFIWHQILLAFYRYIINDNLNIYSYAIILALTTILSVISYNLVENKFSLWAKSHKGAAISVVCISTAVVCAVAGYTYSKAGVFKDYPELSISKDNITKNIHGQYCDRIYKLDVDFEDESKINVLVVGNSFARDWANILFESEYADRLEVSYSFKWEDDLVTRIPVCDYVFSHSTKEDIPSFVWENIKNPETVYGIGAKRFGNNNGMIYNRRFFDGYLEQTVALDPEVAKQDAQWKKTWGDKYIDLITVIQKDDGSIPVFTEDGKFISQDTRHLTKDGAQFYAKVLDLEKIFFGE